MNNEQTLRIETELARAAAHAADLEKAETLQTQWESLPSLGVNNDAYGVQHSELLAHFIERRTAQLAHSNQMVSAAITVGGDWFNSAVRDRKNALLDAYSRLVSESNTAADLRLKPVGSTELIALFDITYPTVAVDATFSQIEEAATAALTAIRTALAVLTR